MMENDRVSFGSIDTAGREFRRLSPLEDRLAQRVNLFINEHSGHFRGRVLITMLEYQAPGKAADFVPKVEKCLSRLARFKGELNDLEHQADIFGLARCYLELRRLKSFLIRIGFDLRENVRCEVALEQLFSALPAMAPLEGMTRPKTEFTIWADFFEQVEAQFGPVGLYNLRLASECFIDLYQDDARQCPAALFSCSRHLGLSSAPHG